MNKKYVHRPTSLAHLMFLRINYDTCFSTWHFGWNFMAYRKIIFYFSVRSVSLVSGSHENGRNINTIGCLLDMQMSVSAFRQDIFQNLQARSSQRYMYIESGPLKIQALKENIVERVQNRLIRLPNGNTWKKSWVVQCLLDVANVPRSVYMNYNKLTNGVGGKVGVQDTADKDSERLLPPRIFESAILMQTICHIQSFSWFA